MNNTRVQRWAILLAESGAEIKYHPGKLNCRADTCSRIVTPLPSTSLTTCCGTLLAVGGRTWKSFVC